MSTERELLAQIDVLKIKIKETEEQNEFNKQRFFLLKKLGDFLGIQISDAEGFAVLYRFTYQIISPISYYLKKEDANMLFERKVINRYAKYHEIRFEDGFDIIKDFLDTIKPINKQISKQIVYNKQIVNSRRCSTFKYIPLFY